MGPNLVYLTAYELMCVTGVVAVLITLLYYGFRSAYKRPNKDK